MNKIFTTVRMFQMYRANGYSVIAAAKQARHRVWGKFV